MDNRQQGNYMQNETPPEPPASPEPVDTVHASEASALRPGWNTPLPEHIPRPTYWPVVMALGITLIFWGLVSMWAMSLVGLILFAVALIGWLGELHHAE